MRVPLKTGRILPTATTSAPRVVIIDARLAKKFWPNGNAVGHRMYLPDSPDDVVKPGPTVTWLQVVGVGSVKMKGLEEGENAAGQRLLRAARAGPARNIGLALRARGNADLAGLTGSVQKALAEIDPELQMFDTFAMAERVEQSLNPRRAPMLLSLAFGMVALLLASVGIYGVMSYAVTERTHEIGIRMALGASATRVMNVSVVSGFSLGDSVKNGLSVIVTTRGDKELAQALAIAIIGWIPW